MVAPRITLTGAVDDINGLGVSIYQDHNGVRIDVGRVEIMLDLAAARKLAEIITIASDDASDWDIDNTNCHECWHLWTLHGPAGCTGKIYPAHSLTGEPCPCEQQADDE